MGRLTRALAAATGPAGARLRRSALLEWEPSSDPSQVEALFITGNPGGRLAAAVAEARSSLPHEVRVHTVDGAAAATGVTPDVARIVDLDGTSDLATEDLVLSFGPVHPALASPLRLVLALDGEQVRDVVLDPGYARPLETPPTLTDRLDPDAPASVALVMAVLDGGADLRPLVTAAERERAAHHLTVVARHVWLLGMRERALAVARLADAVHQGAGERAASEVAMLSRAPWLAAALRLRSRGVAPIPERARSLATGVVARAAGIESDARRDGSLRELYGALGFAPLLGSRGDDEERLRLRLQEAEQALRLARSAEALEHSWAIDGQARATLETPRGRLVVERDGEIDPPSRTLLELLAELLIGARYADVPLIVNGIDASTEEAELVA